MKIRELSVPSMVELGSENILLDCDFDYNDTERIQLDIKWYFEDEPSPFYQWVPEQMARPQIIGEKFRQHIDLDHVVHTDSHKKHRALLLKKPTTELSGSYTCKVSTFVSEDVRRKKMIVYCKFIIILLILFHFTITLFNFKARWLHNSYNFSPTNNNFSLQFT